MKKFLQFLLFLTLLGALPYEDVTKTLRVDPILKQVDPTNIPVELSFLELIDTPSLYAGSGLFCRVNADADGIELSGISAEDIVTGTFSPDRLATGGSSGQYLRRTADGTEWATVQATGGGGSSSVPSGVGSNLLLFSQAFPVTLPTSGTDIDLTRSSDGLTLSYSTTLVSSDVGAVPNVVAQDENGGMWGIQFVDAEMSFDALQYSTTQSGTYNPETREVDLEYILETWSGSDLASVSHIAPVDVIRYHRDFDSNEGFDIDPVTFNFLSPLEGTPATALISQTNPNVGAYTRNERANELRLTIKLKRHDGNAWNTGFYRIQLHRQATGIQPYIVDYQFAKEVAGGGGGSSTPAPQSFTDLTDTPDNYTGAGHHYLRVKDDLTGVEFDNLEASDIQSGEFDTARIPDLSASKITSGAFTDSRIPDLSASKITSGQFTANQIPTLDASKVGTGQFLLGRIPNLTASKITLGQFDLARIPTLPASQVTTGTFGTARIPLLPASQISSGTFDTDRIPGLPATKIDSGIFSLDRVPDVPFSKVTGNLSASRVPDLPANKITTGTFDKSRLASGGTMGQVLTLGSGGIEWATVGTGTPQITGSVTFLGLNDTPSSFGSAGQICRVNASANALEFHTLAAADIPVLTASKITSGTFASSRLATGGTTGQVLTRTASGQAWQTVTSGGGGATAFTGLSDTPSVYTGQADKYLKVNSTASGIEFTTAPTGGGGSSSFLGLNDTPASWGSARQFVRVNSRHKWFGISYII